jgi:polygalacturonase
MQSRVMKPTLALLTAFLLSPLTALHAAEPKVFDITAYGAKSDGTTINTSAIQQAIAPTRSRVEAQSSCPAGCSRPVRCNSKAESR